MPARFEYSVWDQLELTMDIIIGGIPRSGLAGTTYYQIERRIDDMFWNEAGGTWDASPPVSQPMTEPDPVNKPGHYVSEVLVTPDVDYTNSQFGYRCRVLETTTGVQEAVRINATHRSGGVWKELQADVVDPGADDMANLIFRVLALRQSNMRFVPSAWDSVSKRPTAGLVLIYSDNADLIADVSPWALAIGQYTMAATFDGSGQLTGYTSVKDS